MKTYIVLLAILLGGCASSRIAKIDLEADRRQLDGWASAIDLSKPHSISFVGRLSNLEYIELFQRFAEEHDLNIFWREQDPSYRYDDDLPSGWFKISMSHDNVILAEEFVIPTAMQLRTLYRKRGGYFNAWYVGENND